LDLKQGGNMKNRRIVLIAFMLVAVLTMGIGFAVYSTTLAINGTTAVSAEAVEFSQEVKFLSATSENEAYGRASVAADGKTAGFEVFGMSSAGSEVAFTYVVSNASEYDVNFAITTHPTPARTDANFTVTSAQSTSLIPAGGSATVTVTVALYEDVNAVVNPISWTMEYTAISVAP